MSVEEAIQYKVRSQSAWHTAGLPSDTAHTSFPQALAAALSPQHIDPLGALHILLIDHVNADFCT